MYNSIHLHHQYVKLCFKVWYYIGNDKKNLQFLSESWLVMKMIPVPIPLWNISVWNAVIFEKIVSEDLQVQNCRGLFRLGQIEISPIWIGTKSIFKNTMVFHYFLMKLTDLAEMFTFVIFVIVISCICWITKSMLSDLPRVHSTDRTPLEWANLVRYTPMCNRRFIHVSLRLNNII